MSEYIDRQALLDAIPSTKEDKQISLFGAVADFISLVCDVPAADIAPVVHAHWKGYHTQEPYCSNCGFSYDREEGENAQTTDYCGNCGAKMDENEVENLERYIDMDRLLGETVNTIIFSDALKGLRALNSGSVDTCITSPPYYVLRDYGNSGQIGLESTPEEYIQRLVAVFREVHRVLKPEGTLWVVIADSYAGSGKGAWNNKNRQKETYVLDPGSAPTKTPKTFDGIKAKDLMGIPWMLAFALRADGWYLRQDIIWQKTNPMPESVRDRCTKCHEYIFLLSKTPRYYFDGEAIAEPTAESTKKRLSQNIEAQAGSQRAYGKTNGPMKACAPRYGGKDRRNKRDVWTVSTKPYKGAHFATFPPDLIAPCILAGSRSGGTVLDPFCGTATTLQVANQLGRNGIGIELNTDYEPLIKDRLGEYRKIIAPEEVNNNG